LKGTNIPFMNLRLKEV